MSRSWLTTPRPTNYIGDRWEDVLELCETLLAMLSLNAKEEDFLQSVTDRLEQYKERAILTEKQLEWISDLDDRLLR